jgi:hypothetical protein
VWLLLDSMTALEQELRVLRDLYDNHAVQDRFMDAGVVPARATAGRRRPGGACVWSARLARFRYDVTTRR